MEKIIKLKDHIIRHVSHHYHVIRHTTRNTSIAIIVLIIILILGNLFFIIQFRGGQNQQIRYQKQLDATTEKLKRAEQQNVVLEFDRMRLKDASNILLAIQDFYFQKNTFPESLEGLEKTGYLDPSSRLIDPGTSQPYFYQKREQDFVLCVWLSDMIKGVNATSCPSLNSKEPSTTGQDKTITPIENKTTELEIVGNVAYVNVRIEPNTSSDVIAKVNPGDTFTFQDIKDNWYKISVTAEKIGWVSGDYVKVLKSP
jgi:hypothetical protein